MTHDTHMTDNPRIRNARFANTFTSGLNLVIHSWYYLTLSNAKCNLENMCVHREFALVREVDPNDMRRIPNFPKEDQPTLRNTQKDDFQETSTNCLLLLFHAKMKTKNCLLYQTGDSSPFLKPPVDVYSRFQLLAKNCITTLCERI